MTVMVDSTSTLGLQTRLDAVARGNFSDYVPATYLVPGTSIAAEKHPSGGMTGGLGPSNTRVRIYTPEHWIKDKSQS
jgi:hypothetical protein